MLIDVGWLGSPVDVATFVVVLAMLVFRLRPRVETVAAAVVALAERRDDVFLHPLLLSEHGKDSALGDVAVYRERAQHLVGGGDVVVGRWHTSLGLLDVRVVDDGFDEVSNRVASRVPPAAVLDRVVEVVEQVGVNADARARHLLGSGELVTHRPPP